MKNNSKRKFCQYILGGGATMPLISVANTLSEKKQNFLNHNFLIECQKLLGLWLVEMDVSPKEFIQRNEFTINIKSYSDLVIRDFNENKTIVFKSMVLSQTEVSLVLISYLKIINRI